MSGCPSHGKRPLWRWPREDSQQTPVGPTFDQRQPSAARRKAPENICVTWGGIGGREASLKEKGIKRASPRAAPGGDDLAVTAVRDAREPGIHAGIFHVKHLLGFRHVGPRICISLFDVAECLFG